VIQAAFSILLALSSPPAWGEAGQLTDTSTRPVSIVSMPPMVVNVSSGSVASIVFSTDTALGSRVETVVFGSSYTVTTGKTFYLVAMSASTDSPSPMSVRLKVNGAIKKKITLGSSAGGTTAQLTYPSPAKLAESGQQITMTYDASLSRGQLWVEYVGMEF
jgi:hypothetical protein